MPSSKMIAVITVAVLLSGTSGIVACNARQGIPSADATPSPLIETEQPASGEIKVLAEGGQSNIQDSFVAVVRDAETYAALRKLDGMLPDLKADFFETNAVVAAFLGERGTGGYGVEITRSADAINVVERKPGKDAMVTQMITSPFKIVSVAGGAKSPLSLTVGEAWQQRLSPFNISSGQFKVSGGIAGSSQEFTLEGELRVFFLGGGGEEEGGGERRGRKGRTEGNDSITRIWGGLGLCPKGERVKTGARFPTTKKKWEFFLVRKEFKREGGKRTRRQRGRNFARNQKEAGKARASCA